MRNYIEEFLDEENSARRLIGKVHEHHNNGKSSLDIAKILTDEYYLFNDEDDLKRNSAIVERIIDNGDVDELLGWNVKANHFLKQNIV